ncbi:hypothetical protein BGZ57DRAFT_945613 [Hyaloscypha finlandica]|nr:hypothetical protein BGZ57DRAFT_945613 [Hyaloscypha finlandica]
MPQIPKKRGPPPLYQSKDKKYQARKARQREKYQQKRAEQRHSLNDFAPASPRDFQPPADYNDGFNPLRIDDEFEGLLPLPSPSLGSASMDISEVESCELHVQEPVQEDADFPDIDDLLPDVDQSEVEKLAIRLTNQLNFLGESENEALSGCPDILGSNQIAPHDNDLAGSMTVVQKRWVFSGIHLDDPEEIPVYISEVTFDIDSITGFCHGLGIAKGGIRWNFIQMPVSDLQSGLHLARRRVQFFGSHEHFHSIQRPVYKIPHYMLGRLIGLEDVSLYLLFPRLYQEGQQHSRLLDDDFQTWINQVLLPAIYRHHNSAQLQHYPSSYHHGKYNLTARGVEGRSRKVDALPHQLHAGEVVNEAHMSVDFYFNVGKETCPRQTYLSTEDCQNGKKSNPCQQILYPTAMLRDTISMGVKPYANSQLRAGGLLYSQFYSSVKEAFAAGNRYPFTNAAIETLALGAGLSHNPVALIKAYLYAKARCHYGIQGSMQKSFGIREEHRQKIAPAGKELPYTTHPTTTVLS